MNYRRIVFSPLVFFNSYFLLSSILYLGLINAANPYVAYVIISILWINMIFLFSSHQIPLRQHKLIEKQLLLPKTVLFLGTISGFLALFYLTLSAPIKMYSDHNIMELTHSFSYIRNMENIGIPMVVRASNVITHFGAMICSIVFIERLFIKKRIFCIMLLPSLFLIMQGFLIGTKSLLVGTLFYLLSSIFVVVQFHSLKINKKKFVLAVFGVGSIFYILVVIVHYIRTLGHLSFMYITEKIFTSYLWMPIVAFYESAMVENNFVPLRYNFGANTFGGLSAHLLDEYVKRGEFIYFHVLGNEYQTTVYTSFMASMQDFGYFGGIVFFIVIGMIFGFASRNVCRGSVRYIGIYFIISYFFLFSFACSIFKYLTNILAAVFLVLYCFAKSSHKRRLSIPG
jgi:oligosaccharide repeat unit polymerase